MDARVGAEVANAKWTDNSVHGLGVYSSAGNGGLGMALVAGKGALAEAWCRVLRIAVRPQDELPVPRAEIRKAKGGDKGPAAR
jgi:hypothetical protein